MKEFNLYETINCVKTNIYDRFIRVADPFYIKEIKGGKSKTRKFTNERFGHKLDDFLTKEEKLEGIHFIEFNITDDDLFMEMIEETGQFLCNRYLIEWNTGLYFKKDYICSILFRYDRTLVLKSNLLAIIREDLVDTHPLQIKREYLINSLL